MALYGCLKHVRNSSVIRMYEVHKLEIGLFSSITDIRGAQIRNWTS